MQVLSQQLSDPLSRQEADQISQRLSSALGDVNLAQGAELGSSTRSGSSDSGFASGVTALAGLIAALAGLLTAAVAWLRTPEVPAASAPPSGP
jgi:hypothetical protein